MFAVRPAPAASAVTFPEPSVAGGRASEKVESTAPCRASPEGPGASAASQLAEKMGSADQAMTVLVVEDDAATRVIVENLLVGCGHSGARA